MIGREDLVLSPDPGPGRCAVRDCTGRVLVENEQLCPLHLKFYRRRDASRARRRAAKGRLRKYGRP